MFEFLTESSSKSDSTSTWVCSHKLFSLKVTFSFQWTVHVKCWNDHEKPSKSVYAKAPIWVNIASEVGSREPANDACDPSQCPSKRLKFLTAHLCVAFSLHNRESINNDIHKSSSHRVQRHYEDAKLRRLNNSRRCYCHCAYLNKAHYDHPWLLSASTDWNRIRSNPIKQLCRPWDHYNRLVNLRLLRFQIVVILEEVHECKKL